MASNQALSDNYPAERAREKQVSREADALALASGEKSREQLWTENSLLRAKDVRLSFVRASFKR